MYSCTLAGTFWKQKHAFTSAENSGQHTPNVDLHRPVLKVSSSSS